MDDFDDMGLILPEDVRLLAGSLWRLPAFTCQTVSHLSANPATYTTATCRSLLVNPTSRLIFTPWVFGNTKRTAKHA